MLINNLTTNLELKFLTNTSVFFISIIGPKSKNAKIELFVNCPINVLATNESAVEHNEIIYANNIKIIVSNMPPPMLENSTSAVLDINTCESAAIKAPTVKNFIMSKKFNSCMIKYIYYFRFNTL